MAETRLDMKAVFIALFVLVFTLSVVLTTLITTINDKDGGNGEGKFDRSIDIEYENELELKMIQKAENLTPPDGNTWYDEFDGIKLADTVWRESIDYYFQLVENIEKDPDLLGIEIKEAEMRYHAGVELIRNNGSYNSTDTELYRVHLELEFFEYMGPTAALWYDHYRTVVMTEDLEILEIEGDDEKDSVIVS